MALATLSGCSCSSSSSSSARRLVSSVTRLGVNTSVRNARHFAVLSSKWTGGLPKDKNGPHRVCVMMHGILGSKANWNTPARRLMETIGPKGWQIVQLDHRAHGQSPAGDPPHTVEACAKDVLETLEDAGVELDRDELVICGHSFGGKVAIAVLQSLLQQGLPAPRSTWMLDSIPGNPVERSASEERAEQSVAFVMSVVEEVDAQGPFPDRNSLIESLVNDHGLVKPLALWIAQNLKTSADGSVRLGYDVPTVRALYHAYKDMDMWKVLESEEAHVGVVIAGKNRAAWGEENLKRFEALRGQNVDMVVLEGAGHNLHVDDLPGLLKILGHTFEE